MTKPAKISGPRRKLLKSITLGGGTVIAGQAMPRSWTRPVVESVVLPAHAQTSGGQASGSACPTLLIPGITFSCGNPVPYEDYIYRVDDTGECPVLIDVPLTGNLTDLVPYLVRVNDNIELRGVYAGQDGFVGLHAITCVPAGLVSVEGVGDFLGSFLAQSGAQWTASYSVTEVSNGLAVSDIVLQPA